VIISLLTTSGSEKMGAGVPNVGIFEYVLAMLFSRYYHFK